VIGKLILSKGQKTFGGGKFRSQLLIYVDNIVIICYNKHEVIIMNNTKSNVNVKIDRNVKEAATHLLGRMGLDQTTAIELFYRQIIEERRLPFQPSVKLTLDEQIVNAIMSKNIPRTKLDADENGNLIIDKDLHPDLYDWAVNG
jgi:DNA-damage-inducible protein J